MHETVGSTPTGSTMSLATKPCIICERPLECAVDDWSTLQPWGGGQATFHFHFGSCKFDDNMYGTEFVGVICDDCAEKCVERMKRTTEDTRHAPEDQKG